MMYLRYNGITKGDVPGLDKSLIKFRPITNRKLYLFCEKVSSFDFSEIYCSNLSGEQAFELFLNLLRSLCHDNFPEVNKCCSGKLKPFKWYTEELKEQKRVIDALRVVQYCVNDAETGQVINLLKNVHRKNLRKAKIFANDNFVMSATNKS
ncbi:hypothetical protein Zmor_024084 [Zophobas morio]|uniref:Uncharacterized protein n=1 Tax=Zophobas morio TaxID=2755281 RepID=A0AA38I4F4_9CUCU|nr:hypothetical protein Zmor_024084 [Zophobas morio]